MLLRKLFYVLFYLHIILIIKDNSYYFKLHDSLRTTKIGKTVTTIFQIVTVSIGINLKCQTEAPTQLSS